MAVTLYRSTDASAPTLNGSAGSMITVLDACLINGYGAKTALGYTKQYSGTNKAVYKRPAGPPPYLLRVDDTGVGTGSTRESLVKSYETMTTVDAGIGITPPPLIAPDGMVWRKSSTADSTARAWTLVGDAYGFYLICEAAFSSAPFYEVVGWTDFTAYVAGDVYNTILGGRYNQNDSFFKNSLLHSAPPVDAVNYPANSTTTLTTTPGGTGSVRALPCVQRSFNAFQNGTFVWLGGENTTALLSSPGSGVSTQQYGQSDYTTFPYPDRLTKKLNLGVFRVFDDYTKSFRGELRGIKGIKHLQASTDLYFTNLSVYTLDDGNSYMYVTPGTGGNPYLSTVFIQVSGNW